MATIEQMTDLRVLSFEVFGPPRPQGSLSLWRDPKTGQSRSKYPASTIEWRHKVTVAAREAMAASGLDRFVDAVELRVVFDLDRPKAHWGTGRNSGTLKPSAPDHPTSAPDLDKLVRAIGDSLSDADVWVDDAQVVRIVAEKRYIGPGESAGAVVQVVPLV